MKSFFYIKLFFTFRYIEEKDKVTSSVLNNASSEYIVTKASTDVVKQQIERSSKNVNLLPSSFRQLFTKKWGLRREIKINH